MEEKPISKVLSTVLVGVLTGTLLALGGWLNSFSERMATVETKLTQTKSVEDVVETFTTLVYTIDKRLTVIEYAVSREGEFNGKRDTQQEVRKGG